MDTIIITYEDNGSVRYVGKEYVESLSKVRREKNASGVLQIGESVTVRMKSRVWKAVQYRIRFNFRGVKLSRFSRISSHPRKFHPAKT